MEKVNIAFICPDIGIDFGRSRVIHYIISNLNLNNQEYSIYIITNRESNLDEFKKFNINIEYIPISLVRRNPVKFIVSFIKLFSIIKSKKIQLFHSHHRYSDLLLSFISKVISIKTLTTVHSFTFGFRQLSYSLDKIICVSNEVKNHLINEFNISHKKVKVVFNGISNPNIGIHNNNYNNFTVICVGRFDFDKGQDILIKAFEIIWQYKVKINLVLIGEYSPNFIKYAKKNNYQLSQKFKYDFKELLDRNSKRIKVLSSKSTPWEEISKAHVVVIPSRIESFGLVALEAGMLSRCVIAANTGGLKEIINDGENGLLFEPENHNDLSEKILYLYNNNNLIKEFGKNLNRVVQTKYTVEIMMRKYIEVYHELINSCNDKFRD